MADIHSTDSTLDKATSAQRDAEQAAGKASRKVAEETRSFQAQRSDEAVDTAKAGAQTVGDIAHRSAEAVRQIAESSRGAGREVAQSWRASLEPFAAMQMDWSRWFDESFRQMAGFGMFPSLRAARPFSAFSAAPLFGLPAADIKETEKAYVLTVELAGLTREDVELSVHGDMLTISGHKAEEHEDAAAAYRISERRYGRFERSFPIPPDAQRDAIGAAFKDEILKITLPRDEAAAEQRSKITIKG